MGIRMLKGLASCFIFSRGHENACSGACAASGGYTRSIMRLFFVRHGQSTTNAHWDASGIRLVYEADPELTDLGRSQVAVAAKGISKLVKRPCQLYTSLLRRAAQSALIVGKELDTRPSAVIDLHEVGGLFSDDPLTGARATHNGPGRAAFTALYSDLVLPDDLGEEGWWHGPFEAEGPARSERARRVWTWLMARHSGSDQDVVVVAHLGFFGELMRVASGCPSSGDSALDFGLDNGGVTLLDCSPRVKLQFHNRVFDFNLASAAG